MTKIACKFPVSQIKWTKRINKTCFVCLKPTLLRKEAQGSISVLVLSKFDWSLDLTLFEISFH